LLPKQQIEPHPSGVVAPNGWQVFGMMHAAWLPHLHVGMAVL
jgi:hypothetical protein